MLFARLSDASKRLLGFDGPSCHQGRADAEVFRLQGVLTRHRHQHTDQLHPLQWCRNSCRQCLSLHRLVERQTLKDTLCMQRQTLCVCILPSEIVLTDLFVTGKVTDYHEGTLVACYTVRPASLFPTSAVAFTSSDIGISCCADRVPDNLKDGVHNYKASDCFHGMTSIPYLVVDFQSVQKIASVRIMGLPLERKMEEKFLQVAVRVGNLSSTENFNSSPLLGYVDGPPTVASQMAFCILEVY